METASINPMNRVEELLAPESQPWIEDINALARAVEVLIEERLGEVGQSSPNHYFVQTLQTEIEQLKKDVCQLKEILVELPKLVTALLTAMPVPQVNIGVSKRVVDKSIDYDEQSRPVRVKELQIVEVKKEE